MGPFPLSLVCALSILVQSEADDSYVYICGLAEKGLSELVVKEATAFVRDYPQHAKTRHARYRLASALFDLGQKQDAEPLFEALGGDRAFEFTGETNLRLGQCALAAGNARKAEAAFTRTLEWGREYLAGPARALRAEARFDLKDWKGARADWEQVLAQKSSPEVANDARIGLAWCLYRAGDAAKAVAQVGELFEAGAVPASRAGELRCLVGEACLDLGRARDALAAFRAVNDPRFADAALRGAGYALAASGDHGGAAAEFARVEAEHGNSPYLAECVVQCGVERLAAGDATGARTMLSKPSAGNGVETLYWRARAESGAGDPTAALATLDRALKRAPQEDWKERLSIARGEVLDRLGRPEDAARAYEQSGSLAALQNAAALNLSTGHPEEAGALALKILEQNPPPEQASLAWLALGEAQFATKRWKDGEFAFMQAAVADPDARRAASARLRAAWCRYSAGDARGASRLFDAALQARLEPREAEEASFMRARATEAAGTLDDAGRLYREHVGAFADGAHAVEAHVRLASTCDDATAIEILERVLRSHADGERSDEARFALAERLSAAKKWKDAAVRYGELVSRSPRSPLVPRARYGLAWCAYVTGDATTALRESSALASDATVDGELVAAALELQAWLAVQAKDAVAAVRSWRNVSGSSLPSSKKAVVAQAIAEVLRLAKRTDEALAVVADLERATQDPASLARASTLRARILLDLGRLDDATAEIGRARTRAGSEAQSLSMIAEVAFALGEARFDAQDDVRAIAAYAVAGDFVASPFAEGALYKSGFTKLRLKDAAGAERDFARLVAEHPRSPLYHEALFLRGEALYRTERLDEAIACFERVRKEAPRHAVMPKVLFRVGVAQARRERWAEAAEALALLARSTPDFENIDEAELWRGRSLAAVGDARGARSAFDRVVQHDKGSFADRARVEIGRGLVQSGDVDGALALFLKTAVLSGDEEVATEALWHAGDALERLGQAARADQQYREIVEKHAQSPFAARARERLGRTRTEAPAGPKRRP